MRGEVLFTFWLRAENLPPLVPGFMVTLVAHDKQTGLWAFRGETRVYGANSGTGLHSGHPGPGRVVDRGVYGPEVLLQWDTPPRVLCPAMYLDKAEISVPVLDAPRACWRSRQRRFATSPASG